MSIKYEYAPDLQLQAEEISKLLFPHIKINNLSCIRSYGSSSRGTIARCHTLGKVMQMAIRTKAFYAIEVLSEKFDKMSEQNKTKVIIHELMHIPKTFGGGFIYHNMVNEENVEIYYKKYLKLKEQEERNNRIVNFDDVKNENFTDAHDHSSQEVPNESFAKAHDHSSQEVPNESFAKAHDHSSQEVPNESKSWW